MMRTVSSPRGGALDALVLALVVVVVVVVVDGVVLHAEKTSKLPTMASRRGIFMGCIAAREGTFDKVIFRTASTEIPGR